MCSLHPFLEGRLSPVPFIFPISSWCQTLKTGPALSFGLLFEEDCLVLVSDILHPGLVPPASWAQPLVNPSKNSLSAQLLETLSFALNSQIHYGVGSLCLLSFCPLLFRKCNISYLRRLDDASHPGRQDPCHRQPVTIATHKMVTQPSG